MLVDVEPSGGLNFGSCIKSTVLGMWRGEVRYRSDRVTSLTMLQAMYDSVDDSICNLSLIYR